jgi:hypothetical protein
MIPNNQPLEQRARITQIAEDEFEGAKVIFNDETAGECLQFSIEHPLARLSRAFPHFPPSEIASWSDEEMRARLRVLCGFPSQSPARPFSTQL